MAQPIYLDYQATTPLDKRVLDAMMPYFEEKFGNPHSATHRYGWEAAAGVDIARENIASVLNVQPSEVIFTSGATEANNLALKGVMRAAKDRGRTHLITVVSEHKCVLESAHALEREGIDVTYLPVRPDGIVDLQALAGAMTDKTALLSVMAVNNEIGVIQPLKEMAALAHEHGALFHSDAAQAFGKMPLDVKDMGIDLASISGHKIYGPKGVGALYLGENVKLCPHMDGGGQEGGIRSGTLSPALCVGFGQAARIADEDMTQEMARARRHFDMLLQGIEERFPALQVNGSVDERLYSNLNVSFPKLDGERLLADIRGIAVSSGAACASATTGPSYVLQALGVPKQVAQASLRIGTGRFTSDGDIVKAIDVLGAALARQKVL